MTGSPTPGGTGWTWTEWAAPAGGQDGDPTRLGQLFVHPMEDPFAWWDARAQRFRMLTHTFRMGMVCGASTSIPCGPGGKGQSHGAPMGALASSGGAHPFANWSYHEDMLAYNWSVPVIGGGTEDMRRRERPFLLFDDDGNVYLYTSVSPGNSSLHMYTHVQQVTLPRGVGGPASRIYN